MLVDFLDLAKPCPYIRKMTSGFIKTFLLILFLAFGLTGQAFAHACQDMANASVPEMADHQGHDTHKMADVQMHDGCPNCQQDRDCDHTSFHCAKAAGNSDVFVAVKKVKAQVVFVLPSEVRQFKTRHHQIRPPGPGISSRTMPPLTLTALHVQLQV